MLIFVRLVQFTKAQPPISVTQLGMTMLVRPLHPSKAHESMDVIVFGMVVFLQPETNTFVFDSIIALQLFRESKNGLSDATVIFVILGHPAKGFTPISATPLGIVIEVNPSHKAKAPSPILLTEFGMDIFDNLDCKKKAS